MKAYRISDFLSSLFTSRRGALTSNTANIPSWESFHLMRLNVLTHLRTSNNKLRKSNDRIDLKYYHGLITKSCRIAYRKFTVNNIRKAVFFQPVMYFPFVLITSSHLSLKLVISFLKHFCSFWSKNWRRLIFKCSWDSKKYEVAHCRDGRQRPSLNFLNFLNFSNFSQ